MAPGLLRQHRHLDVLVVLEAIANDRRLVIGQRHHRHQFGLRARFQAEFIRLAELEHFLHHLPLLIHFDGIHAAISALIVVFGYGGLEGAVDLAQTMLQNIGEPDQDRQIDAAQH